MNSGSLPVAFVSLEGHIVQANAAYAQLLGWQPADLAGLPVAAVLDPDDADRLPDLTASLLEDGWPQAGHELRHVRADGTVMLGAVTVQVVRDPSGGPLGCLAQVQDVTARRDAEARMASSERTFRLAMEHAPMGMVLLAVDGTFLRVNRAMTAITGRSEPKLLSLTFKDITHPEDLGPGLELVEQVLAGQIDSYQLDKRYSRPDGSWIWVRVRAAAGRDEHGQVEHIIGLIEDLTEDRRAARELADNERRFRMLADGADTVMSARVRVAPELRVEYMSRGTEAITGHVPDDFYADPALLMALVHPEDRTRMATVLRDPDQLSGDPVTLRLLREDGSVVWLRNRSVPVLDDSGAVVSVQLLSWDVTTEHEAAQVQAASERRFRALVEHAADGIAVRDANGLISYASPAIERMLGYPQQELLGTSGSDLVHEEDRAAVPAAMQRATASRESVVRAEVRAKHRDGSERWLEMAWTDRLADPDVGGVVVNLHDVTARRAAKQELAYQATHDPLTALPNRSAIQALLEQVLANGAGLTGVLFVDLAGLEPVSDTLGLTRGDAVLLSAAGRVARAVGTAGKVGRFGGEEFAVVTVGLDLQELRALAELVVRELERPIVALDGGQAHVSAAVGVACGQAGMQGSELLANAYLAAQDLKRGAARGVRLFDAALAEKAGERLALERDLRGVDMDRDLLAHFQPVIDVQSGRVVNAEALLRWVHPTRGRVPPGQFIPIAEEIGLIDQLGLWVLRQACLQQVAWTGHGLGVAVNVSPQQLYDPDLASRVADLLDETGARPDRLVLEVTESALIDDRVAVPALAALKDLGLGLALDDFGTGYSSLTSLRRYPFDVVKIDRSFVGQMTSSVDDQAVVHHVVDLAHALRLRVVAEGVETDEQLALLARAGADMAQGFLLGRPCDAADLTLRLPRQPGLA